MGLSLSWNCSTEIQVTYYRGNSSIVNDYLRVAWNDDIESFYNDFISANLVSAGDKSNFNMIFESLRALKMNGLKVRDQIGFPQEFLTPELNSPTIYRFNSVPLDTYSASGLVDHVRWSIANARLGYSKLTGHPHSHQIFGMTGMSSTAQRHLLNNLCSAWNTRYLEIGVWEGSTFVAALAGNEYNVKSSLGIDYWAWDDAEKMAAVTNPFSSDFNLELFKNTFGQSGDVNI